MDTNALIIFVDARNFTGWANNPEVFARLNEFAATFNSILRGAFPKREGHFIKTLGDGAMIVRRLEGKLNAQTAAALLEGVLGSVMAANEVFTRQCIDFAEALGQPAALRLGWGIVRGPVQALEKPDDYVGPNVNKCARLCHEARPFGVIVDANDFPLRPEYPGLKFYEQTRKLAGLTEAVEVWVTKEIATQFLTREQLRQRPEVHVAGQCIDTSNRRNPKILIARRLPTRRLYGGLWEGCGGQLAANETFADGVRRHYQLEMRIDVRVLEDVHCFYVIREPNEQIIPGIRFLCERLGDAEPQSPQHSELRWVTEAQFRNMPDEEFIPGLKEQVLQLIERYKRGEGRA